MATGDTDEKLQQILGAIPRNHQSCVQECRTSYQSNVSYCSGDPATRQACLDNARTLLEYCINGCPNGFVQERAAEIVKIIVDED